MSQFFFPVTQNTSKKEPVMKDPTTSASSFWPRAAILYFFVLFPLSFLLPGPFAWETDPLKWVKTWSFLQVSFGPSITTHRRRTFTGPLIGFLRQAFSCFFSEGKSAGAAFSSKRNDWDRTCFLEHERPPLSSCHRRRHWTLIGCGHPSLLSERERSKTLHCLKKNRLMFLLTVLAAILALMGDKGQLFHDFRDETMEELSELFVYLQVFFFIHQYRIAWPFYRFRISWMEAALLGRFFWFQKVDKLETMR